MKPVTKATLLVWCLPFILIKSEHRRWLRRFFCEYLIRFAYWSLPHGDPEADIWHTAIANALMRLQREREQVLKP